MSSVPAAVVGLGVLVYSIIEAPNAGWLSARTVLGLAGGLVALAGFVLGTAAAMHPLLDPRLFRVRGFTAGSLTITSSSSPSSDSSS